MATLITKNSSTASAVPAAGDLVKGELAVNVTDKKVYTKDNSAAVVKLVGSLGNQEANAVAITGGAINGTTIGATTPSTGAFTTASASSGFTGNLTGNVTGNVSGTAANVTGVVAIANGGTGLSALGTGVQSALGQAVTGSGSFVLSTSPSLTTPNLGTPSAAVLTNATGLPLTTGVTGTLGVANGGTGITAFGTGVATALGQNVTGSGGIVLATSPSLTTPNLGTPSAATLTNATGLPISTGVSGLGTGVATALGVATGSAGAFVVNGGALGTPSSGTVTNLTGTASININGTVGATTPTTGAFTTLSASGNITVSGGTANGVAYLNGSKVLTTGSALTFDGSNNLTTTGNIRSNDGTTNIRMVAFSGLGFFGTTTNHPIVFQVNDAEQARLTSTGLGIGTSSPAYKLDVSGSGRVTTAFAAGGAPTGYGVLQAVSDDANTAPRQISIRGTSNGNKGMFIGYNTTSNYGSIQPLIDGTGWSDLVLCPSGGNVGIGTSSITYRLDVSAGNGQGIRFTDSVNSVQNFLGAQNSVGLLGTLSNHPVAFFTNNAEKMRLDSSGNLGLGVTPSAWGSGWRALQIGALSNFVNNGSGNTTDVWHNGYVDTGGNVRYLTTAAASFYRLEGNTFKWFTAPSGTAGTAISFTQAMTLDASGRLGIGTTTPFKTLQVEGTIRAAIGNAQGIVAVGDGAGTGMNCAMWRGAANAPTTDGNFLNFGGYDGIVFATGNNVIGSQTERARITSGGDLCVGASSSIAKITGYTTSGYGVAANSNTNSIALSSGGIIVFGNSNLAAYADGGYDAAAHFFRISGAERARITSGGYFKASNNGSYIGSTGTYHEFYQTADDWGLLVSSKNASQTAATLEVRADRNTTNGSFNAIRYYNVGAAAAKFVVADSGNVTNTNNSYGAISDIKLKENIADATPKLASLNQLRVVNYNFKGSDLKQIGLVAQEVEQVFPGLVETSADRDAEGNDLGTTTKSVKYSVLVPMLLKAVQELTAMNDDLRARVAQLEAK